MVLLLLQLPTGAIATGGNLPQEIRARRGGGGGGEALVIKIAEDAHPQSYVCALGGLFTV